MGTRVYEETSTSRFRLSPFAVTIKRSSCFVLLLFLILASLPPRFFSSSFSHPSSCSLDPRIKRRVNVVQFRLLKPAHLPFHMLVWGQSYVRQHNCMQFVGDARFNSTDAKVCPPLLL